jgi:hypothetical protein
MECSSANNQETKQKAIAEAQIFANPTCLSFFLAYMFIWYWTYMVIFIPGWKDVIYQLYYHSCIFDIVTKIEAGMQLMQQHTESV